MSGALAEGVDHVVTTLADAGIPSITDVRRLTPGAILVEPPSIVGISAGITEMTIPVSITAAPGDPNAVRKILEVADSIIELLPVTTGEPGIYATGNQELPSYRLTARITVRR
jgi:hypothetical protein